MTHPLKIKIAVLGSGITGIAVTQKVRELPCFTLAPPRDADLVVTSPGIPPSQFPRTRAPIISEIEWAYQLFNDPRSLYRPQIIAVTGTNGKSTVATLLGKILNVPTAGNIGLPLITFAQFENGRSAPKFSASSSVRTPWIIVEVSSYQLESITHFHPRISIILNITDDHLVRHRTLSKYARTKALIFKNQTQGDLCIYNTADGAVRSIIQGAACRLRPFNRHTHESSFLGPLRIKGPHNRQNAMAAYLAARECGLSYHRIVQTIRAFNGLSHRIETIATRNHITFVNDSKATNPDSTIAALLSFPKSVIVLMGGKDKHARLDKLTTIIKKKSKFSILMGEAAPRFSRALTKAGLKNFAVVPTMASAVALAYRRAKKGDTVLLSPACSSFDHYTNFEERGNDFRNIVQHILR